MNGPRRLIHLAVFITLFLGSLLQPAHQTQASGSRATCTHTSKNTLGPVPGGLAQSWAANVHLSGHFFHPGDMMTATVTSHINWCKKNVNSQPPCYWGIAWPNTCQKTALTCSWKVSADSVADSVSWQTISFSVLTNMDYAHSDDYYTILGTNRHVIDGHVTSQTGKPLAGGQVAVHGPDAACAVTDGTGYYSVILNQRGIYRVTPSRDEIAFSPASAVVALVKDRTVDFTALMPMVTGTSPASASADWEAPLKIHGRYLKGATKIAFVALNGLQFNATNVRCATDTLCTATTPAIQDELYPGTVKLPTHVQVSGPPGESDASYSFYFTPLSIVQVGDSVASGEGTLEGWTYNTVKQEWTGGQNVSWPGPYPLCHDSPNAYGQLVATALNGTFTQLACTGANWRDGITGPEMAGGTQMRPAEFGDWASGQGLNPVYDDAHPDVVLVTMGADDIEFAAIVKECVMNALGLSHRDRTECTAADPGPMIEKNYMRELPDLAQHYALLAQWIEARGNAADPPHVPKIVFTNYYNPLPRGRNCPDGFPLDPPQLQYLSGLQDRLAEMIKNSVQAEMGHDTNIGFADFSNAMSGHEWCSSQPWAYGLSILLANTPSSLSDQAPFHPIPQAQQELANRVGPVVKSLLPGKG